MAVVKGTGDNPFAARIIVSRLAYLYWCAERPEDDQPTVEVVIGAELRQPQCPTAGELLARHQGIAQFLARFRTFGTGDLRILLGCH